MDMLQLMGIGVAVLFVLLLVGIAVVVIGGIDLRPFGTDYDTHEGDEYARKHRAAPWSSYCPKCSGDLRPVGADHLGLYQCDQCGQHWQQYGTDPLIEVFGTPVDKEGGDNDCVERAGKCPKYKEGGNHETDSSDIPRRGENLEDP